MGTAGSGYAFSGAGLNMPVRPTALNEQQGKTKDFDRLNSTPEHEVAGNDGLSHHGEPEAEVIEEDELEVEVLVEEHPGKEEGAGPSVLKAPRAPARREIDDHMATHLPRAAWCGICMRGRGRNSPHRRNPKRWARRREGSSASKDGNPECPQCSARIYHTVHSSCVGGSSVDLRWFCISTNF